MINIFQQFRQDKSNRISLILNIVGLVIGIAASILLFKYVLYENSFDKFHENYDNIYRVTYKRSQEGKVLYHSAWSFSAICPAMKQELPEVDSYNRIFPWHGNISTDRMKLIDQKYIFTNSSFFDFFSFKLIKGNPHNLLNEANTVVISEDAATKLFGRKDPMGKLIMLNDKEIFKVVGVLENIPKNSHFHFDYLFAYETAVKMMGNVLENNWKSNWVVNYVSLKEGTDYKSVERKLNGLLKTYRGDLDNGSKVELFLQPLGDIHLHSKLKDELGENGNNNTVNTLLGIAILIMVVAWINFINLTTVKAIERAKEIGVKKVLGAFRGRLIKQFLVESLVLNLFALFCAILLSLLLSPIFDNLLGTPVHLGTNSLIKFSILLSLMLIIGSFLSGIYPAIVMSSFEPDKILKGNFAGSVKGNSLRRILITFQYIIAFSVLASVIIIIDQLNFLKSQDLGYTKDKLLIIKRPKSDNDSSYLYNVKAFKEQLEDYAQVQSITTSKIVPGRENPYYHTGYIRRTNNDQKDDRTYYAYPIDYDFIPTYGLQILAGRNFSKDFGSDKNAVILDEASFNQLGFSSFDEALKSEVYVFGKKSRIIGITRNFAQQSLNNEHSPTVFSLNEPRDVRFFSIKINSTQIQETIRLASMHWKEYFGRDPFEYFFLDEHFNEQYGAENRLIKLLGVFALIAVLISSVGIFGLSYFEMIKRMKEIGIRKVLGSSITNIFLLTSRLYLLLIGISVAVASPIVYFFIKKWLNNYIYKIDIPVLGFIFPLLILTILSFLTVSYNILKVAVISPSKTLNIE